MSTSKIPALREKIFARLSNKELAELSALELDLLMQHLRELYEELDALKNERSDKHAKPEISISTQPVEQKPIVIEKKVEVPVEQPVQKQQPAVHISTQAVSTGTVEKERKTNGATLNEKVDLKTSLNEKLKPNSLTEVHHKLSTKPLKDLIDLNKKHVLVNELFAGDAKNYVQAIEEIDAFVDYDTAHAYLRSHLITARNWDESSQPVRMFVKLVKQKFAVE